MIYVQKDKKVEYMVQRFYENKCENSGAILCGCYWTQTVSSESCSCEENEYRNSKSSGN